MFFSLESMADGSSPSFNGFTCASQRTAGEGRDQVKRCQGQCVGA